MSLRVKLTIIFLAFVSIPLVFVNLITFTNYEKSLETSRLTQLQDLARFKTQRIEAYFSQLKTDIEMAQSFYNIRKYLPVLIRFPDDHHNRKAVAAAREVLDGQLQRIQKVLDLSDIMLTDSSGRIVYASNPVHCTKDISRTLAGISAAAFREGRKGVYFSDILLNPAETGMPEMLVTAPVSDLDNYPIGIIVLEADLAPLYGIIQDTIGLGKTGEILVGKKSEDEIIYLNQLRHDPAAALTKRIHIGDKIALPVQNAVLGKNGTGQSIDYRGKKVIAAWRYIPSLGLGLVAKIDREEAFASVTNLKSLVIMILAVVFAMVVIITFSVSQSISGPIKRLSKGAEIIGSGNLDYKVGTDLKDEIGQLSRSFDKMTHDLKAITASRDELNREITEREKVEHTLHQIAENLARSNKDLEQFAYVASHDLQEPLRAVAGFMALLKKQYRAALDTTAQEFIDLAVEGTVRMQTLIHDLLTYSRVGTRGLAFEPISLKDAVDGAQRNLHAAIAQANARIFCDSQPTLHADLTQMTQLMQNLIGNAIKFHGPSNPEIRIGAERKDQNWVVSVSDNGIGIEPQYFDRIFLIFQRLHSRTQYEGTGIGLAICKRIVERHGGSIMVESKAGQGSTFYFTIPYKGENE